MPQYLWHEAKSVNGLSPITQVSGVCFNTKGEILLLRQTNTPNHRWNIPGGHPEAGESPSETLMREVYEEVTVVIGIHELIGYQEVLGDTNSPYYQLRYATLVKTIEKQQIDPDKGTIHERLFVPPERAMDYITYPQYRHMFDVAVRWFNANKT
jgi:ADP-ribose pyrophosphatase YjhB (NUDIX family)